MGGFLGQQNSKAAANGNERQDSPLTVHALCLLCRENAASYPVVNIMPA